MISISRKEDCDDYFALLWGFTFNSENLKSSNVRFCLDLIRLSHYLLWLLSVYTGPYYFLGSIIIAVQNL